MRKVVFVDLDRTLFDTVTFLERAWQLLGKKYGFDGLAANDNRMAYYYSLPQENYAYDFERHLQACIPGAHERDIEAWLSKALHGQDFLFPDATEIFAWQPKHEVRILTFGETQFQQFKLSLCPQLTAVPCDIILEPKNSFIGRHYAGREGWLVDDRPGQRLPAGFTEINLVRGQALLDIKKDGMIIVNSLNQVTQYL